MHDDLENSLHFGINFSSRAPLDLVPHQKVLWILEAWRNEPEGQVNSLLEPIATAVLLLYFNLSSVFVLQLAKIYLAVFLKFGVNGIPACGIAPLSLTRYYIYCFLELLFLVPT